MTKENTTTDQLHTVVEPVYVPWRDPRTDGNADPFASRRTTGNNLWDPNSYLTGEHIEQGMTYTNSVVLVPRNVPQGDLSPNQVRRVPRVSLTLWESASPGFFGMELVLPDGTRITKRGEGFALLRRALYHTSKHFAHEHAHAAGLPATHDEAKEQHEAAHDACKRRLLRVGDKVWWRGSWGEDSGKPAHVRRIARLRPGATSAEDTAEENLDGVFWSDVVGNAYVFDLDNGHFAYAHQIERMPVEVQL